LTLTAAQIRRALVNSAIGIMAPGWDRDSGVGILMADTAVQSVLANTPILTAGTVTATENPGNGNGAINAGEGVKLFVQIRNIGTVGATSISATMATATTNVT